MSINDAMKAAYENNVADLKKEIDDGISVNSVHPVGKYSLLQAACENDAVQAIEYLLEYDANPNQIISKISRIDGRVILDEGVALMYVQSVDVAKLLIKHGADVEIKDRRGNSISDWADDYKNSDLVRYYSEIKKS